MRLSADGSLRLSPDELLSISLRHLVSGVDETARHKLSDCGRWVSLTGYTEWISKKYPNLTVGWDCYFDSFQPEPRWVRVGPPRTNLVLVSDINTEYQSTHSILALASLIDSMDWHEEMSNWITKRYR
jgi:hypothetical protein